ncbi:hypothetical protein GCM10028775_47400 [Catellatospora paridis]
MLNRSAIVSAWNQGNHYPTGAGYGVKLSVADRERLFDRAWRDVIVELDHGPVVVTLSPSFWATCSELRSAHIGRWLISAGLAPWRRGSPPRLRLELLSDNRFRLST